MSKIKGRQRRTVKAIGMVVMTNIINLQAMVDLLLLLVVMALLMGLLAVKNILLRRAKVALNRLATREDKGTTEVEGKTITNSTAKTITLSRATQNGIRPLAISFTYRSDQLRVLTHCLRLTRESSHQPRGLT